MLNARTIGYYAAAMKLREDRQKGVVDTLYQVEKSAHSVPRRSADRLPRRRMVAANVGPAQGPV